MENLLVVVSCYKNDYFLTKICVASVKYFHPDAEVYLLKDYLAGYFDTTEIEKAFDVKIIDLGKKEYGWGAAKVHFILSNHFAGQRVFIIDSDTVFAGHFLRSLYDKTQGIDFVVDPEYHDTPYGHNNTPIGYNIPNHYYKYDDIVEFDSEFKFPGFVFNTGHLIVTPGRISTDYAHELFDISKFPYYKRLDILHMPDQSLLNYWLPTLARQQQLTFAPEPLMVWSDSDEASQLNLQKIKQGDTYQFLIHWAGVLRVPNIDKMSRPDILHFFQDYYYTKVPLGGLKKRAHMTKARIDYYLRNLYRKHVKPLLKR